MQNIKAKKESLMRLLGMVLILFGLLITLVLDCIFVISNVTLYLLILCIVVPWFILIVLLKLEIDFFVENTLIFYIILSIYSVVIIGIGFLFSTNTFNTLQFVMLAISDILLIICWNSALSIYKKEKIIFLLTGIGYFIINPFFRVVEPLVFNISWIMNHVPIVIVAFGMLLIIFAEFRMKKKGLLNYI